MGSAEAAELAKLAETTYRDLNIAFANEFARFADRVGIDVARVIEAANSQPFSHIHRPGRRGRRPLHPRLPPLLPAWRRRSAAAGASAREVNEAMPATRSSCWAARSAASAARAC